MPESDPLPPARLDELFAALPRTAVDAGGNDHISPDGEYVYFKDVEPIVRALVAACRERDGLKGHADLADQYATNCETVIAELRAALAEAVSCIEGLSDQQVIYDGWYEPILAKLKVAAGPTPNDGDRP